MVMYLCIMGLGRLSLQGRLGGVPGMENNDSRKSDIREDDICTFQDAKQLLYDSRGKADSEAPWWELEKALNDYRDAKNEQERRKTLATVGSAANALQRSRKDKEDRDRENAAVDNQESKWVGLIPAVTLVVIGVVAWWFGRYMGSLSSSHGLKDASSLLKALVFGVSVCTALLSLMVIILNGVKLSHPSEPVKRFVDYALYMVSWAALVFSALVTFFNARL